MSRIPHTDRHVRRGLACGASPPGTGEPHSRQPDGQEPHLASWPGRDGLAARPRLKHYQRRRRPAPPSVPAHPSGPATGSRSPEPPPRRRHIFVITPGGPR